MTLAEGVPPELLAATTDLGDATYQHDDHHRDLAAVCDAYLEFLADTQTPYFLTTDNSPNDDPASTAQFARWIGEADKFLGPPAPMVGLGALDSPFVGPGIVTDPLGYNPNTPLFTGPGALRALKTGIIALQFAGQIEITAEMPDGLWSFEIYAENGTEQQQRIDNAVFPRGRVARTAAGLPRYLFGGTAYLTILEADRLDNIPYTFPTYPSYTGLYAMNAGVVPLGWDIYPTITLVDDSVDVSDWQMDHMGMQIMKVA